MRSAQELESRLVQKGFPQQTIKNTLDFLAKLGYVNDLSFAKAWVNSRLSFRPRSRKFLGYELRQKGVDKQIIAQVLSGIDDETEMGLARMLASKKYEKIKHLPPAVWQRRLAGYLSRRGFDTKTVLYLIKTVLNNEK